MKKMNKRDDEEPTLEAIAIYLAMRAKEEGKTKEDAVVLLRKAWDDLDG